MKSITITPHVGFEKIKLGFSKKQVEDIMGKPDDTSEQDFEDGIKELIYEYEELFVDLSFTSEDEYRLGAITFYLEETVVLGKKFIGISEDDFHSTIEALKIEDLELIDVFEDLDAKDYFSESLGIAFWVQEGVVDSITMYPKLDDDDKPVWPN